MRIVCLSDTHAKHQEIEIPEGDLILHTGDFTNNGERHSVENFSAWFSALPHQTKIVIAGNHDKSFERNPDAHKWLAENIIYLQDTEVVVGGLKIWGSPWQPSFGHGWAFNLTRGSQIRKKWEMIPEDTDILLTHGPPFSILDYAQRDVRVGCEDLIDIIDTKLKNLKLHQFGHIHEDYGVKRRGNIMHINASLCDLWHQVSRSPIVLEYEDGHMRIEQVG